MQVASDYGLDMDSHVAISTDGAATMIGQHNSLTQKIKADHNSTLSIHCTAHRLSLACSDTVKALEEIQTFERLLNQIWRFFAVSPLKSAKLAQFQKLSKSDGLRLKRSCRTRWLSCEAAIKSMYGEIWTVWETLAYFKNEKRDYVAAGLLEGSQSKKYLFILFLLYEVVTELSKLSKIFQNGHLYFSHLSASLKTCKATIFLIQQNKSPNEKLQSEWSRFEDQCGTLSK